MLLVVSLLCPDDGNLSFLISSHARKQENHQYVQESLEQRFLYASHAPQPFKTQCWEVDEEIECFQDGHIEA